MAPNTLAVFIMRYGAGMLQKWNKNELQKMGRKIRKFMTMNKELHPRTDVAWLYVSRGNGGTDLLDMEMAWRVKKVAQVGFSKTIKNQY